MAAWSGLVVGFVELGLFAARVQWEQHGLARKTPHYLWMIPAADLAIFGLAGWVWSWTLGRGTGRLRSLGPWLLGLGAVAAPLLAIPGLPLNACLLLATGVACWLVPLIDARPFAFRSVVRLSARPLVLVVLAMAGVRFTQERRVGGATSMAEGTATAGAPDIVLLVLDTVRADALDPGGPMPRLGALARRGVSFQKAIAAAPWTLPSHAAMFTGRRPSELALGTDRALDDRFPTLAETLARRGYDTGGFVANTLFCSPEYGLARGFAHYEAYPVTPLEALRCSSLGWLICRRIVPVVDRLCELAGRPASHPLEVTFTRKDASTVGREALDWIAQPRSRPYFAFLNFLDAHDPYLPPSGFGPPLSLAQRRVLRDWGEELATRRSPEELRLALEAYHACLTALDDRLGQFLDGLARLGRLDRTVIVVTADHGEHFGEHSRGGQPVVGHRQTVYQPEVHVPLTILAPGRIAPGTVVEAPVSLLDLPATLLDLAGLGAEGSLPGRSLVSGVVGGRAPVAEYSASTELSPALRYQGGAPGLVAVLLDEGKAYHRHGDGTERLYDLTTDPGETLDLAGDRTQHAVLERLRAKLGREARPVDNGTADQGSAGAGAGAGGSSRKRDDSKTERVPSGATRTR